MGHNIWFLWAVNFLLALSVLFYYFKFGYVKLPKTFKFYLIFLLFFLITLFWSRDPINSIRYFFMFLSGGLMWILIFNFGYKKDLEQDFGRVVILLGIAFGIWFMYKKILGIYDVEGYNLISYSVDSLDHHHFGDLMSVVMGVIAFKLLKNIKSWFFWFLAFFGVYFLLVTYSRSSYVSIGVGMLYLLSETKSNIKRNLVPLLVFICMIFMTLVISSNKSLIAHRLFYVQGISGVYRNPFGVGVGNFSEISLDPKNHLFGIDSYTGVADNIFLEMLTGMGIFGLSFIYWFFSFFKEIFGKKSGKVNLAKLIFVILTANFLFNYIYFIPTMLWIWFFCIGLLSTGYKKKVKKI